MPATFQVIVPYLQTKLLHAVYLGKLLMCTTSSCGFKGYGPPDHETEVRLCLPHTLWARKEEEEEEEEEEVGRSCREPLDCGFDPDTNAWVQCEGGVCVPPK